MHRPRRLPPRASTSAAAALALALAGTAAAAPFRIVAPLGEASGDFFGTSIAAIGDINGDGAADWIVGAPGNAAAGFSAGRAYVYFGGAALDSIPDLVLTGQASADNFGRAVAGAGDVNGDGHPDVIVGARNNDTVRRDSGRSYVFFGGPGMDTAPDWFLNGLVEAEQFGNSVAGAGDVNGDGFDDVIVGANRNDGGTGNGLDDRGRASIYFGAAAPDLFADWFVTGEASGDHLGVTVAGAGDVNGDGFADVLVGASRSDAGGIDAGRAYLYFGGAAPDTLPDLVLTGEAAGDSLGFAIAGGGDVNGDGHPDLAVGAFGSDAGGERAGRVYVLFGGPGADAVPDWVLTGWEAGQLLGRAVGFAGDVNGDGFDDLIAGAPGHGAGGAGAAFVYFGGASPDGVPDLRIDGTAANDGLGIAVAGVGDVNGDGRDDFGAGAHQDDAAGLDAGRVFVFGAPDASTPVLLSRFTATPGAAGVEIRWRLASLLAAPVEVERTAVDGRAWARLGGERRRDGEDWVLLDAELLPVPARRYRLVARDPEGARVVFGPIEAVWPPALEPAIRVAPNPSAGPWIEFVVPRAGRVRIEAIDAQGRVASRIADDWFEPGRRRVRWASAQRLGAGVYWVRYLGPGGPAGTRAVIAP